MNSSRLVPLALITLLSLATLSACSSAPSGSEGMPSQEAVVEGAPSESPLPQMPEIDITTGAPAAGTNESLAWEALMGPDGEYSAAASYAAVLETFGSVEPYATIYDAEVRHADALIRQLERAGVVVPGNPYMGRIAAPDNLTTAALAWAEGEVLNVEMYDVLIAQSTDTQLTKVLTNLREASLTSHLPLFEKAAANGGTLTAEQMQR